MSGMRIQLFFPARVCVKKWNVCEDLDVGEHLRLICHNHMAWLSQYHVISGDGDIYQKSMHDGDEQ